MFRNNNPFASPGVGLDPLGGFGGMDEPEEEAPRRRRGGLLGRLGGLRGGGSALDRLLIAQSIANGDIGQAMQMRMGMQRQRALQQQAEREAAEAAERRNFGLQAFTAAGGDKTAFAAMDDDDWSASVRERYAESPLSRNLREARYDRNSPEFLGMLRTNIQNDIDPIVNYNDFQTGLPTSSPRSAYNARLEREGLIVGGGQPQQSAGGDDLEARGRAAIARGADPEAVRARIEQIRRGGPQLNPAGGFPVFPQ